jgi:hypothetical protein
MTVGKAPYVTPPNWHNQAMRWANLTLVQNDPGKYDPQFWLDFIKHSHCDAASWNSGGIVAFYPTRIPFHRRNEAMGDSDPLKVLVDGCRELGIITTARVDHHATYEDAALAHPEWIACDAQGNPRRHWANPEMFVTCAFGPYNYEFMTEVMKEIVTMYGVDGFNHNRWSGSGVCFCDHCRRSFAAFSGLDIPQSSDPFDTAYQRYQLWRQERIFELWDLWESEIRKINPNAALLPGMGTVMGHIDLARLRKRAHALYHDHQGRYGIEAPWTAGKGGKELRAVLGIEKPVGLTFSVGLTDHRYRWKDSVQSDAETRIWVANGVANGMYLKFCKFAGYLHDKRWPAVVEEIYTRLFHVEPYLRNTKSLARVAMLFSQQTSKFYKRECPHYDAKDHEMGMYQALVEARIPFEMVHENLLEAENLDAFKLIVLPNIACLSQAQCEKLRTYVERGGSLLATHETSLYDEWGVRRENFGLADLFGVDVDGQTQGPMQNSYLRLEHGVPESDVLLAGLEDVERIINGIYRVPVKANAAFGAPSVTLIPPYPDLPMEEVYPREDHTGIAEVYAREFGKGRVLYVPSDLDRTFWVTMNTDHALLLRNLIRWSTKEEPLADVRGPGIMEVTAWEQHNSMTIHLVNLTNPMLFKGYFRELIPSAPQTVRVRLPKGKVPQKVKLLFSESNPVYTIEKDMLEVVVPTVLDHEIVALDW